MLGCRFEPGGSLFQSQKRRHNATPHIAYKQIILTSAQTTAWYRSRARLAVKHFTPGRVYFRPVGKSPKGIKPMTDTKRGTSSVAALVMARTAQRVAERDGDPEMMANAIAYEKRALDAIRQHLPELPPKTKRAPVQLRFSGF
jgi:hypothetical protein